MGITNSGVISAAGDSNDSYCWNGSAWVKTGDNAIHMQDASETYMIGTYGNGASYGIVWDYADPAKYAYFRKSGSGLGSFARGSINDANDTVVTDWSYSSIYTGGSMQWIPAWGEWDWMGGTWSSLLPFVALSINNSGQIAGYLNNTNGGDSYKAMVYDRGTATTTVIPFLAGGVDQNGYTLNRAEVSAISDNGVVTGYMYNNAHWNYRVGFVWDALYGTRSLMDPAVVLGLPSGDAGILYAGDDVNDYGLIVGTNYVGDLFLLTPVPEPATLAVLACGLVLAGLRRRR